MPKEISLPHEGREPRSDSPTHDVARSHGKVRDFATRPQTHQYAASRQREVLRLRGGADDDDDYGYYGGYGDDEGQYKDYGWYKDDEERYEDYGWHADDEGYRGSYDRGAYGDDREYGNPSDRGEYANNEGYNKPSDQWKENLASTGDTSAWEKEQLRENKMEEVRE